MLDELVESIDLSDPFLKLRVGLRIVATILLVDRDESHSVLVGTLAAYDKKSQEQPLEL